MCPQQLEGKLEQQQDHQSVVQSLLSVQKCSSQKETEIPCILLGELVGACELKPDGHEEMQPYCLIKFGDRIIHRTLESTDVGANRPIWTIGTRSLFLLKMTSKDLVRTKLTISVWNRRRDALFVADTSFLGEAQMDVANILMHCNEERFEVKLDDGDGVVALRFRIATEADRSFVTARNRVLEDVYISKKVMQTMLNAEEEETKSHQLATIITETAETQVASKTFINAIAVAFQWQSFTERGTGIHKIRSKPHSDPMRPQETEFMTHNDIRTETFKPSHHWVETGSGKLGTLHLEILACHGLPNVDTGEAMGNVTDAFVCAVFEDAMVQTPVIDDELSPHWLPWTQRAFRFGVLHPASFLYLGVFDYDLGITDHEAIGRVAINISSLQRDTTYTLKYDLHKSSNVTDRTSHGEITVRLRLEVHDEKAALMAALKPRPRIHVNVKKEKSFRVVRYTCFGEYDNEEKFDITVLRSYINEFFEYKSSLSYCISDSLCSLMFWRGQVEILTILVPVHSFLFFCAGCTLVERPYMLPSFLLLGAAWIMLASMSRQRHHPSPWMRPQSFNHYMHILWTGKSSLPVKRIAAAEGLEETLAYEKAWEERLAKDLKKREEEYARIEAINDIGNDKIHTKVDGMLIPLDLLVRMARYQNIIGRICRKLRFFKMIMTWEESIVSFWITAGFLAAGLVSLLLPWSFILTWVGRMTVWVLFGPHMKLVDLFLQAQAKKHGDVDKALAKFHEQSFLARLRREEAVKLKAVKEIRFGRFSTEVPAFNLCRHYDRPLPQSSARIYHREAPYDIVETRKKALWLPGQQLYGSMIPRPDNVFNRNKELEQKETTRLLMLEARLAALRAAEASGGGLTRIAKRVSLIRRAEEPQASGYELLCRDESEVGRPVLSELCIGPYQEEPREEMTDKQIPHMSFLTDGSEDESSVIDSSEQNPKLSVLPISQYVPAFEEEGLEVVACGRLIVETKKEKEEEEVDSSVSFHDGKDSDHETLSMLYRASDSTFVAFYRP